MLKNLGNIIFLLLLIPFDAYAWVKTFAPQYIMKTEALEFTVVAKGFHIKFPKIEYIDGYVVKNIKTSHEAVIIDARKANKLSKTYSLTPDNDVTLPAFNIEVDGKVEKTQPLHVTVKKLTQTRSPDYKLSMDISNKTPMVGEKVTLHVKLVYKDLQDYDLFTPVFNNFSLQELSDKEYKNDKDEWIEEVVYDVTPQRSGTFILHPAKAKIELSIPKYKKRNIYSNALTLLVTAIPNNLSIVGSYELNASVNTKIIRKNQPVKFTLYLQGSGNINNFDDLNIRVPGATVYEKSTKKLHRGKSDIYQKSFEIVSDKNFTIPSVSLQYFDIKEKKIKNINTQDFAIIVKDSVRVKITTKEEKLTIMEKTVYFMSGVFVTLLLIYMYKVLNNAKTTDKQKRVKKELQNIHAKEELLKKVVPYLGKDKSLNRLIYALENVENSEFKKLKKEIIAYMCKQNYL